MTIKEPGTAPPAAATPLLPGPAGEAWPEPEPEAEDDLLLSGWFTPGQAV
ncbi:hypothetical protein [Streptomyces sp. cmx-4-9]